MRKEDFLFEKETNLIEKSFTEEGWITVYQQYSTEEHNLIYPCIVTKARIKDYAETHSWRNFISPYKATKACIINEKYHTYAEKGIEPFIFVRHFNLGGFNEKHIDISEEFILYFNLYEIGIDKQNRIYYYIDNEGEREEVIVIGEGLVKVKQRFLMEYISIRKVYFSLCFTFINRSEKLLEDMGIIANDEIIRNKNYRYRLWIRNLDIPPFKSQIEINGKLVIPFNSKTTLHFEANSIQNEEFITGYKENGEYEMLSCTKNDNNALKITFFKKQVLDKYLNDPSRYEVGNFYIKSDSFYLRIDNDRDDCIPVLLCDLSSLPQKEQSHWKNYNILPEKKVVSNSFYNTFIEGSWDEKPEAPDLYFKHKYEEFNQKWEDKFGWKFYKPLSEKDEFRYKSLHIPTSNNVKAFCEQIFSLSVITIDRLNEEGIRKEIGKLPKTNVLKDFKVNLKEKNIEIPENITVAEKTERGLSKLERFLKNYNLENAHLFTFLRTLYDLRSGLLAHGFSDANEKCKDAIGYFGIENDNYIEVAKNIFTKSIRTMDYLEKHFLQNK